MLRERTPRLTVCLPQLALPRRRRSGGSAANHQLLAPQLRTFTFRSPFLPLLVSIIVTFLS